MGTQYLSFRSSIWAGVVGQLLSSTAASSGSPPGTRQSGIKKHVIRLMRGWVVPLSFPGIALQLELIDNLWGVSSAAFLWI